MESVADEKITPVTVKLLLDDIPLKEKDDKEVEQTNPNKKSSSTKSSSGKNNKQSGRNSRRDSVGVVPVLLEPPPNKQRRGSLQLPFREHFFNKGDSKSTEGLKVYDDNFGSLRGRDKYNKLSIDDTFYPPTSPSGTWTEAKKNKSQKLSVVNLFTTTGNKDRERQDQLTEILNRFSTNGLPPLPDLLTLDRPHFDESMFIMELNWRLLVDGDESLTKKQQEHQEAIWELLQTEVYYIKQIRVIIDVFRNCLINIQNEGFLNDVETDRLFSNIDKIYECNCTFWQKYLLPVLIMSREYKKPLDPLICKSGFVEHFPQLFEVYFKYVIEHKACLDYAKSCMENSDLFKTFILWAEAQKQCNRLKMADILVKPMQRLVKYSLLLQAIFKHTENEIERADLKEMIQSVDKVCSAANNSLQRREEYEKLEAVKNIIDNSDAIEAPTDECAKIIQEYSNNFSLLAPITGFRESVHRSLLFQASLKMREAQNTKTDVECFLFTDLILICKSKKSDKYKIIKPPMRLDQLVVSDLKEKNSFLLIYMNEYRVPISAFTFQNDPGAIRLWLEKFREAQKEFKNRKLHESLILPRKIADSPSAPEDSESTVLTTVPSDQSIISYPRTESVESADQFLPTLTTPGDLPTELGHSSSTGDIESRSSRLSQKELLHINTDPKMSSNSDFCLSDLHPDGAGGNQSVKHKQVTTCRSVPNINVAHGINSSDSKSQKNINDSGIFNDSEIVNSLPGSVDYNSVGQISGSDQYFVDEDLSKQRLNARRVSRSEKRYHTADSIQEIKNLEKDSTIHKRLSWRTDVDQSKNISSKVLSTDSMRSFPSSSGVSSTASLHLNMESDITEEVEGSFSSSGSSTQVHKIFSVGGADDMDNGEDDLADNVSNLEASHPKSRSMSDLITKVNSLHVIELKDGIASVAVESSQIKLTPADIIKFKKLKHQVLEDANIESSEV
uniref:DH domain-containing protein n=1 Tax=Biomphalaria glabrata TaxID=6526 RepID=A0A2C9L442_BIOGL